MLAFLLELEFVELLSALFPSCKSMMERTLYTYTPVGCVAMGMLHAYINILVWVNDVERRRHRPS